MAKMTIGLSSSSIDKLTGAGVILSGAAADDIEINVFVLVNAAHAFLKNNKIGEIMSDLSQTVDEFKAACEKVSTPTWIEFFEMAKDMTEMKIIICSLAGNMAGSTKLEDYIDIVDDFCGIGEYLDSALESDIHLYI